MIETTLRTLLLADATVEGLVVDRVHPLVLPQKPQSSTTPWLPAVTYQRISRLTDRTVNGDVGPDRIRIQIDSWATTFIGARELGEAVRLALEGRSIDGDEPLLGVFLDGDGDEFEADVAGSSLYRFRADYIVWAAPVAPAAA